MALSSTHRKLLIGGVILLAAIGYLCYAGINAGRSYCLSVDTFLSDSEYHDKKILLYGTVGQEDLVINFEDLQVSFLLLGENRKLQVQYHGVIPDMFKADAEVVVRGRLGEDETFKAEKLLTKCASKYEKKKKALERPS